MSLRRFENYRSSYPGELPEYGAIFMSNRATKKECFSRKLLGLPMAQAAFVTQVKAGMILFLFEFEKRELNGVFRAVSDGAINIVPHAYSSSGKQFPAQVKFEQIWHCFPLKEPEFRAAIRENYFDKHKFRIGLSETQVRTLLVLFSSRKIKDDLLQMDSPLSKVPRILPSYLPNLPSLCASYVPNHIGDSPSSNLLNSVLRPLSSSEDVYPDRTSMLSAGPICPEIEARKIFVSENHRRSDLAHVSLSNLSRCNKDHSVRLDNNDLNSSMNQNAHFYPDCKYRVSVFDRLDLPAETSKSNYAIGARNDECYSDSSVNAIMDGLRQDHSQWMKTRCHGSLNSFRKRGIKGRKILNSKVLNDPEAQASKEVAMDVNDIAEPSTAEGIHFLDFKRRSKTQNTHDDAVNVDSADLSLGKHKRRKLIRPNFHKHESYGDYITISSDSGSKPSENVGLPLMMYHGNLQVRTFYSGEIPDLGEDKVQNCEGKEASENCDKSLSREDEDKKSPHVDTQSVFSPVSCRVEGANIEYRLESTAVARNLESLRNAKVDDRKGTPEKTCVLDLFSSVSRGSNGKDADERLSLGIIAELEDVGSMRNTKTVEKEESDKNDVPNNGDPNPENVYSLESSEAGKLVELSDYACYTILQELTSVLSREKLQC